MVGFQHYLALSGILFGLGFYTALSKRNAIVVLMGIEVMFNAVNVAVVAIAKYLLPFSLAGSVASGGEPAYQFLLTGQVFAIFVIAVAAAEVALGLGIVLAIYRARETVDVSQFTLMKE
ncbi:MAG: NADH-quinone oxidoreductase subunit NuoK [Chloroflexi bacterium]|nr:NADH-quinone oxidoreductase subunit NuoK [Chloroflexota bacterium]